MVPAFADSKPISVDDKIWILTDSSVSLDVLSNDLPNPDSLSVFSINSTFTMGSLPNVFNNTIVTSIDLADFAGYEVDVNPITNTIYVIDFVGESVIVIDGETNAVVDTVNVGGNPRFLSVNPATNSIYVSGTPGKSVTVIDGETNTIVDIIEVELNSWSIEVNPVTNKVYVMSNSDEELVIIDGNTNTIEEIINMGGDGEDLVVNPTSNMVYLGLADEEELLVLDGDTNIIIDSVELIQDPTNLAINTVTNLIYVNLGNDGIFVVDGETNMVTDSFHIGDRPLVIAINELSNTLYVTGQFDDNVSVIDGFTNNVLWTIGFNAPTFIDVNPLTGSVYAVTHENLSVLDQIQEIMYKPPPDFLGTDSFSYRSSDGVNISESAQVTIMVTDELPVAGQLLQIEPIALLSAGLQSGAFSALATLSMIGACAFFALYYYVKQKNSLIFQKFVLNQ